MHGIIIIRPAIEIGWHDTLLAQQSSYLRAMIDAMVDGLDQHDDSRRTEEKVTAAALSFHIVPWQFLQQNRARLQ